MRRTAAAACAVILATLAAGEAREPALDSLVEAERAFSRLSGRIGHVPAFLAYFGDDVVTFRPAPATGKDALRQAAAKMPVPSPHALDWEPWYADISSAGDLGYTTGPSLFKEAATGKPLRPGWYFSVWKHDANGWRVAADIGVAAPAVEALRPRTVVPGAALSGGAAGPGTVQDLLALERQVSEKAEAAGLQAAYEGRLGPSARLFRDGSKPIEGPDEIRAYLAGSPKPAAWQAVSAVVSASGDLAFTYGTSRARGGGGAPAAAGFLHVWKRGGTGWLLVADVLTE